MNISVIAYDSPEYREMLALRYAVLREPWGLKFSPEDMEKEANDVFIGYHIDGKIVGCCILTLQNSGVVKLRQMAVLPSRQKQGIGASIIAFAEQYAIKQGYSVMILHARKTAVAFYEKYGYTTSGDPFVEIGMPHIAMEKRLCVKKIIGS